MAASDARAFAHELAERGDESLAALLALRGVSPRVTWDDAFDAAEALLEEASIAQALTDLTAAQLDALAEASGGPAVAGLAPGATRDALAARGLLDADGRAWQAVAAALEHARADDQNSTDSVATPLDAGDSARSAPDPVEFRRDGDADGDAHGHPRAAADAAAERAFTAAASLADVLQAALAAPLGRIGAGTLGAVERRRLIEAGAVPDAASADALVAIAERAGLLAGEDRALLVTAAGLAWLGESTIDRWSAVAEALIAALPEGVRPAGTRSGGWVDAAHWPGAYPLDPAWPARADEILGLLRCWAVLDEGDAPAPWALPASVGGSLDLDALRSLLPPEVDRVYLQNDLTAIAPGSLAPHLDMRLRSMTTRESRAQASTYRFTAESLADALTAGETAESLRAFLQEISLTGVPQPLAYEIERSATRHGMLRVGPDWSGRTRVWSDDEALLRTLAVDQALRPLGLVADEDGLVSRSSPDTAFWMIADARYPVVAVDADGSRRALDRHRLAAAPAPTSDPVVRYGEVIDRLRAAAEGDADAAWLGRELDQAVRARAAITVAVRLPDGTEREFTIEATGLGGGRLRGLDRTVDVERTLPVSSIVRVTPA